MDISIIDTIIRDITELGSLTFFVNPDIDDNKHVIDKIDELKQKIGDLQKLKTNIFTLIDEKYIKY